MGEGELIIAEQLYKEVGDVGNELHSLAHELNPFMTCETYQGDEHPRIVLRFGTFEEAQKFHSLLVKFFSLSP